MVLRFSNVTGSLLTISDIGKSEMCGGLKMRHVVIMIKTDSTASTVNEILKNHFMTLRLLTLAGNVARLDVV